MQLYNILLWTFAIYGIICLIVEIMRGKKDKYSEKKNIVITVKNQQENIENLIQELAKNKNYLLNSEKTKIILVDLNSTDDTVKIARLLEKKYEFLKILSWEEYKEKIEEKVRDNKNKNIDT